MWLFTIKTRVYTFILLPTEMLEGGGGYNDRNYKHILNTYLLLSGVKFVSVISLHVLVLNVPPFTFLVVRITTFASYLP